MDDLDREMRRAMASGIIKRNYPRFIKWIWMVTRMVTRIVLMVKPAMSLSNSSKVAVPPRPKTTPPPAKCKPTNIERKIK